jgi:AraC family transcriptional regulator, melibiose operon regulatory protein
MIKPRRLPKPKPVKDTTEAVIGFDGGSHEPAVMARPHLHQEIELNYLPAGTLTYLAGGRIVRVPAKRLAIFWAAAPHQVIAVEGAPRFYWFTLPFAWVLQWKLPEGFMEALLHGRFIVDEETAPDDEVALARWHEDLSSKNPERLRIAQLEMEARVRRLLLRSSRTASPRTRKAGGGATAVQAIAEFIARHYTRPLTVAEIVAPTGLHPNYAMTLFRETCGLSILDYLVEHRLFHARRLLATTDMKVLEVAMESGFGSLSRFNEAFARANGCPPRVYRQRLAGD